MFSSLKQAFSSAYTQVTQKIQSLFGQTTVDPKTIKELEQLLLAADTGVATTSYIIQNVKKAYTAGAVQTGSDLYAILQTQLLDVLTLNQPPAAQVLVLVGINGSGKTSSAGKLAYYYKQQGKKVLLVAADTFRAAAPEQLQILCQRVGVDIVLGKPQQDPSSVIYGACQQYKSQHYDILIIDTAGRLQTKTNLMQELAKIDRTIKKQLPDQTINTLLTVDAVLGQNSLEQAKLFHEAAPLHGIILTKMDSSAKGGIIFAIAHELRVPIIYMSCGEQLEHLLVFNPEHYVSTLLKKELSAN